MFVEIKLFGIGFIGIMINLFFALLVGCRFVLKGSSEVAIA